MLCFFSWPCFLFRGSLLIWRKYTEDHAGLDMLSREASGPGFEDDDETDVELFEERG